MPICIATDELAAACQPGLLHRMGWKRQDRPVLEGNWCCSQECLTLRMQQAIQREANGGSGIHAPHPHRVPLGLVLLQQGKITLSELQQARRAQADAGEGRIGEWIRQITSLTERDIAECLALQWNAPFFDWKQDLERNLATQPVEPVVMPAQLLSESAATLVPYADAPYLLVFSSALSFSLAYAVERVFRRKVRSCLGETASVRMHREQENSAAVQAPCAVVFQEKDLLQELRETLRLHRPVESRLVRVHEYFWLRMYTAEHEKIAVTDQLVRLIAS